MATATSSSPPTFPAMQGYERAPLESSPPCSPRKRARRRAKCVRAAGITVVVLATSLMTAGLTALCLRLGGWTNSHNAGQPISRAAVETEAACGEHSALLGSSDRSKSSALDRLFDSMVLDIRLQRIARLSQAAEAALSAVANASRPAERLALQVARLRDPRLLAAQSHDSSSLAPLPLDRAYLREMAGHFGAIATALRGQLAGSSEGRAALRRAVAAVEAAMGQTRCLQHDLRVVSPPAVDDERPAFAAKSGEQRAAPRDAALLARPEVRLHVLCRDAAQLLRRHGALCAAFVELDARLTLKKAADGSDKESGI